MNPLSFGFLGTATAAAFALALLPSEPGPHLSAAHHAAGTPITAQGTGGLDEAHGEHLAK